ncbi:hypothetical protein Tco_0374543 [Tanacetum coccineum]
MRKTIFVTVSGDQYAVFNGTKYAVLILLNEYTVLDRKLDTPYPMEVDTPYRFIDQNSDLKSVRYGVSIVLDTAYWGFLRVDVYLGHVFSDSSESVWKELQETYDRIDGSIVFNLLQKINSFKQSGLPISEYYHKLNSLWREFDILTKLPDYVCEARVELIDHGKLLKLMPFLMGLDDIYQPIRSSLLTREILHEVNDTFVTIAREESHRAIPLTFAKSDKPQAAVFVSRTNDVKRNNSTAIWNNGNISNNNGNI